MGSTSPLKTSLNIAQAGKSHNIGEKLLKPSIIDAVETVINHEAATQVAQIPLSRHTVKRRITSISDWIESKVY
jgi:hypothetical protein